GPDHLLGPQGRAVEDHAMGGTAQRVGGVGHACGPRRAARPTLARCLSLKNTRDTCIVESHGWCSHSSHSRVSPVRAGAPARISSRFTSSFPRQGPPPPVPPTTRSARRSPSPPLRPSPPTWGSPPPAPSTN